MLNSLTLKGDFLLPMFGMYDKHSMTAIKCSRFSQWQRETTITDKFNYSKVLHDNQVSSNSITNEFYF